MRLAASGAAGTRDVCEAERASGGQGFSVRGGKGGGGGESIGGVQRRW